MKVIRIIVLTILIMTIMQNCLFADGWKQTEFGNWQYEENGELVKATNKVIDGVNYYFDTKGNWIPRENQVSIKLSGREEVVVELIGKDYENRNYNTKVKIPMPVVSGENETIIKQICDSIPDRREYLDSLFWYNKRSSPKDIVMSYICSSIIEILSLIGAFIWYNDTRRIKYCIKNKMIEEKGIINYGPLGDYLGNNYNSNNVRIINDDIIYSRGNLNMNLNMRKKEKDKEKEKNSNMNISSVINSSISNEKKVVKNENTNVQNDEIIKEKGNESYVEEEKRDNGHKENSLYSADFY